MLCLMYVFFFKQKTAYEMRISDWSSDVCSSDLGLFAAIVTERAERALSALAMDEIRARSLEEPLRLFGRQLMDSYMSKALLGVFRIAIIEHVRRSEERRVGKEGVSKCRSRCEEVHKKKHKSKKSLRTNSKY